MDRTAAVGDTSDPDDGLKGGRLPRRRPQANRPDIGGDPVSWFGGDKPSDTGSLSSPVAASASSPTSPLSSPSALSSPAVPPTSAPPAPKPVSSPPEFGPASPAGPGRVSFGFSDGPIGGVRPPRGREDTGSLPRQSGDTGSLPRQSGDTGSLPRQSGDTGAGSLPKPAGWAGGTMGSLTTASGAFPSRRDPSVIIGANPGYGADEPADDTSSRRRGGWNSGADPDTGSGEPTRQRSGGGDPGTDGLPVVRKSGNGTDGPEGRSPASPGAYPGFSPASPAGAYPAPDDSAGAGVPWPASFESGPSGSDGATFETASSWPAAGTPREPVVFGDTPPPPGRPEPPRQSRLVTVGMAVLGVVALAAIALTGVVYYTGDDNQIRDMLQLGGTNEQVASGPINDMNIATFELMAATDRVRLRIDDLGEDLYRISSPEGSGVRPSAELRDDRLRVDLTRETAGTGGEVEVVLTAKVRWTIRFSGYSAERIVDLSQGRIKGIELVGGTRRAEMNLAQASGTVPMRITGGVEELILRAPTGSPVRIKVGGGAGTVTAGAKTLKDVAPGSTLTPRDWTSGNRYDVDAIAPVTLLKVETSAPS